jgi:ArsR family transcriptional regulator
MRDLISRFKALSEGMRLQILALLFRHGELCVCEVERFLEVSQSKASRHLRYLLHSGLVEDRRDGLWIYYRIAEPDNEKQALLVDTLRELLADAPVPDVSRELELMRAGRPDLGGCPPGGGPAADMALRSRTAGEGGHR